MHWEYHLKELDISNITYEDYAITIDYIIGYKDGIESKENRLYWKNAVANHLTKELAEELYHL